MTVNQPIASAAVTSLCLKDDKSVSIESVKPIKISEGWNIRAFAVAPTTFAEGVTLLERRPMKKIFEPSNDVTISCDDDKRINYLYIEVERPQTAIGRIQGLEVKASNGKAYTMGYTLTVCRKTCPE